MGNRPLSFDYDELTVFGSLDRISPDLSGN
jgi:hypothetical protein